MVEAIRQGDIPGVQLRHRQPLDLSVDEAWAWLTLAERLERWLAERVEVEGDDHVRLKLERAVADGAAIVEEAETLERQPPREWVLSFRQLDRDWRSATRLTWALHPREGGCELDVLHEGFEHLSLSTCLTVWEEYRRRWRDACSRLAELTARAS